MKYLVMICRGQGRRAVHSILSARGAPLNKVTLSKVVRHFHLAFKGRDTAEIYDILMEQFLRAVKKYDPAYTDKVKIVAAVINEVFRNEKRFSIAELNDHLEFDSNRYIRLFCRRGFLTSLKEGKEHKITRFQRSGTWPPPASFFASGAIGFVYYLQTWFRYYLQQWIAESMSQFATRVAA